MGKNYNAFKLTIFVAIFFTFTSNNSMERYIVATGSKRGKLRFWDLKKRHTLRELVTSGTQWSLDCFRKMPGFLAASRFNRETGTLALGFKRKTVRLLDFFECEITTREKMSSRTISAVSASKDGKIFAAGDSKGTLALWNTKKDRILYAKFGYKVISLIFHPIYKNALFIAYPHKIIIFNTKTKKHSEIMGHHRETSCMALSPCGNILAVGSYFSRKILLRNLGNIKEDPKILKSKFPVHSIAFNADGGFMVAGSSYSTKIAVWRAGEKKPFIILKGPLYSRDDECFVAISPD